METTLVVTLNEIAQANRTVFNRFADPESFEVLFGEELGDDPAEDMMPRRKVYKVRVKEDEGTPGRALEEFRAAENAVEVHEDFVAAEIPEPWLPSRQPESEYEAQEDSVQIPEPQDIDYAGLGGEYLDLGRDGRGSVYPNGVPFAILDTGMDDTWATRRRQHIVAAINYTNDGYHPLNAQHFHGTHVAGTATAGTNLKLHIYQCLHREGWGYDSWITAAIYEAVRRRCRVINLSLGGSRPSATQRDAIAYARRRGCLPVCAMGNDSSGDLHYPAAYPGSIAVIASDWRNQMRASFSNWGDHASGTTHGVSVLSWGLDGALVRASGTSMATPLYARVLALEIAEHGLPTRTLRATQGTSVDTPEPQIEEGFGRIHGLYADRRLMAIRNR